MSPSADRRQHLAAQMMEAQRAGELHQLELLRSQWVHRYGVDSLPVLAEQADPVPAPFPSEAEPAPSEPTSRGSMGRLKALLKQSLLEVSSSIRDERSSVSAATGSDASAPPVNTPRSLRRWLVQDGDNDLPKAS